MEQFQIIHVAQIAIEPTTGMGRIACEWEAAAQRNGIKFTHIGPKEVGPVVHRYHFPVQARKQAERLVTDQTILLIHEPCVWGFRGTKCQKVGFSHGIELRAVEAEQMHQKTSLKRKFTGSVVKWLGKRSLSTMDRALVSNTDDREYLIDRGILTEERIFVFRNGVDTKSVPGQDAANPDRDQTIVFNASWLPRKGTAVLIKAAMALASRGIRPRWHLIGTGFAAELVSSEWPEALREDLTIIPSFKREEEFSLISQGDIYILPSYFEGQSLSLLQAMEAGLCCITTDCCGQKDIIQHGKNGLLFAPGDEVRLAELIEEAWNSAALRRDLGQAAAASVAGRTWPLVSDEIMRWLKVL